MEVNYKFVPEFKSTEAKYKSDVVSYAGNLLEIVGASTLVVGVDNNDVPFVLECEGRLVDALDLDIQSY